MKIDNIEISRVYVIDFRPTNSNDEQQNIDILNNLDIVTPLRCYNVNELKTTLKNINDIAAIVIQIICHGGNDYIANSKSERITYEALFDLFREINLRCNMRLIVNLITVCLSETKSRELYCLENPQFFRLIAKKKDSIGSLPFKDSMKIYTSETTLLSDFVTKYGGTQYCLIL
jgi:hypothetical protein